MDFRPLEQRPLRAYGSAALLLLGTAISLFGLSLPIIGWITALTARNSPLPSTSVQQVLGQQEMLNYAGTLIAISGVPFMLLGILAVVVVWLMMD